MARSANGPATTLFRPVPIRGNCPPGAVKRRVSGDMARALAHSPIGLCTCWGISFQVGPRVVLLRDAPWSVRVKPLGARWLVFMHAADRLDVPDERERIARTCEKMADYVVSYADGTEARLAIVRSRQIGAYDRPWGIYNGAEAVGHRKPHACLAHHEQAAAAWGWGGSQTRAHQPDRGPFTSWLWAWENPRPDERIVGVRFEPVAGTILLSAISVGSCAEHPLRWRTRRKAVLTLPRGAKLETHLDDAGQHPQIRLDMGQVISVRALLRYPDRTWAKSHNNAVPDVVQGRAIVEYASHADARFYVGGDRRGVPVARVESGKATRPLEVVRPAVRRVTLRVVDKASGKPVAVKLHVHGEAGEHLAPLDRHRIPNEAWFEDYSPDFVHRGLHECTYVPGETVIDLPEGEVYVEVSKGFEIRPVRTIERVTAATREITITLEKALDWRERGWVTADTHVHFLSPTTALLEGAGEGVNVVNLLASQWGELMTNVGDFDGRTTWGSREAGGDGEYLVRVGTENRQHVLGHISLLGYEGRIIAPMTTGGPDESALGDPVEALLTEWARRCRAQGGVVVIPHFPAPRWEHAATIVSGEADGVEMTSWGDLYGGISPYSLVDWYRYLNCGYFVAAVGGTDKMSAGTAVGTVRTYAKIESDEGFDYGAWKEAVRRGNTFVTYGPLMDLAVDGRPPGSRIRMPSLGGTVEVIWRVASVTVPMSKVELVVNGEVRESKTVDASTDSGSFSLKVDRSSWVALLVRGHYAKKPEIVAAHSSPVMIEVGGSPFYAAADAVTILAQIEGALAYLDTVGTRAADVQYKRMRLVLTSAHRALHNRMHAEGRYHVHGVG